MSLGIIFDIMEKTRENKQCVCCGYLHEESNLEWHLDNRGNEGLFCRDCVKKDK